MKQDQYPDRKSKNWQDGVLRSDRLSVTLFDPLKEKKMNRFFVVSVALMLALNTLFLAGSVSTAAAKESKIMEFDTMVGVPQTLTGAQAPIRGINGGGLPWVIGAAEGELKASGHLEVKVQGLVFAAGPNTGKNTVTTFRAIVSCLTSTGAVENVMTDPFPATTGLASEGGGNAEIEADLTLPQPCIAPLIFVTSPGGAWFAVTGY
jgi:hypothetical protein